MTPFSKGNADIAKVLGDTRWRLLGELCRRHMTASELADVVQTSANAVRVHLSALEDAGLVEYAVERRQVGKPTHVYSVTAAGEAVLSRAYAPALAALIGVARGRLNGGLQPLLRDAGRALAATAERNVAGTGLQRGKSLLDALGAPAEIASIGGQPVLRAACCPLGSITRQHPETCVMLEAAVSQISGIAVRERCTRGTHPQCGFSAASPE